MTRTRHGLLALSALLFLSSASAWARVDRAGGIVKDSDGGTVPGATVIVTSLSTHLESRQQTSETGSYQVGNLIPGRYQVDVELSGFKKSSQMKTSGLLGDWFALIVRDGNDPTVFAKAIFIDR